MNCAYLLLLSLLGNHRSSYLLITGTDWTWVVTKSKSHQQNAVPSRTVISLRTLNLRGFLDCCRRDLTAGGRCSSVRWRSSTRQIICLHLRKTRESILRREHLRRASGDATQNTRKEFNTAYLQLKAILLHRACR